MYEPITLHPVLKGSLQAGCHVTVGNESLHVSRFLKEPYGHKGIRLFKQFKGSIKVASELNNTAFQSLPKAFVNEQSSFTIACSMFNSETSPVGSLKQMIA